MNRLRLIYCANMRLPTEKAHGLQIMQNCEAFAQNGAQVTLYAARRINSPQMRAVTDPFAHYGVNACFQIKRIACLDLYPILERFSSVAAFGLQAFTYTLFLFLTMLFRRADVYYSRDVYSLLALSLIKPRRKLVYEAHQLNHTRLGKRLQSACVRRVGLTAAVTEILAEELRARGGARVIAAPDGFSAARFGALPSQASARDKLDLPDDLFLVGYVGRLHTMGMSKGLETLIDAAARCRRAVGVCIVGGPDHMAAALAERWRKSGLPADWFVRAGQVSPTMIPLYLAAFDVCALTSPYTEFFAHHASPLKLFEYMAAGGVIVASDLPANREIVREGETALLYPPDSPAALAEVLRRLYDDAELRSDLGRRAKQAAAQYTWEARAGTILKAALGA